MYLKIDVDPHGHRKAILSRVDNKSVVAIVDALPRTSEKATYDEVLSLNAIDVVKRELTNDACKGSGYEYTIFEEAICLKNTETCTVFSYTVHILCKEEAICDYSNVLNVIRCLASIY